MNLKKSKSKTNALAELHFVSSLQLEQSLMLISNCADEKHTVTVTEINQDEYHFEIMYIVAGLTRSVIRGTLQRWNGTETKVDANAQGHKAIQVNKNSPIIAYVVMIAIFISFLAELLNGFILNNSLWTMFFFLGCVAGFFMLYIIDQLSKPSKKVEGIDGKEAKEYLFQKVIDAFKSAGEVQAL